MTLAWMWRRHPKYRTKLAVLQYAEENPGRLVTPLQILMWMRNVGFSNPPYTATVKGWLKVLLVQHGPKSWSCVRREPGSRARFQQATFDFAAGHDGIKQREVWPR